MTGTADKKTGLVTVAIERRFGFVPASLLSTRYEEYSKHSMSTADAIYQAVKPLPEPLAREVLDFVEFLRQRGQPLDHDLMLAQQSSLDKVWNNADDEVWN